MRQETINIYKFDELSNEAQEKAINWYRENQSIVWGEEWINSLNKFCNEFGIELCDWNYSFYHGVDIKTNIEYLNFGKDYHYTYRQLKTILGNDCCPFTGYCGDESLLAPLREALKKHSHIHRIDILRECLQNWKADFESDLNFQQSDEYITESIISNEYEFTKDGSYYS